jgi:hypothetical protein
MKAFCVCFFVGQSHHDLCQQLFEIVGSNDLPQCEFYAFLTVCFFVSHILLLSLSLNKLLIVKISLFHRYRSQTLSEHRKNGTFTYTRKMLVTKQISE